MRKNVLLIGFNIWFIFRIIGILFLCYLQYLAVRWLAVEGGLFLFLTYGIIIIYLCQLIYLLYSIIGVNKNIKYIGDFLFWGAIIIIIFDILIFLRNQILLFPISGVGDLLVIIWLINHSLLREEIIENKLFSIKRLIKIINLNEKTIYQAIIVIVIILFIIEILIAIYLLLFNYWQYYY
jgi:hypothetical protein